MEISNEVLSGFSPYWREHINRFGVFTPNMDRNSADLEYNLAEPEI